MSSSRTTSPPVELKVSSLFQNQQYLIPLYQRNYAWEEGQTTQLVRDIWDFRNENQNYYIGTLVVYPRVGNENTIYETIDGQQRLTTLHILLSVLYHEHGISTGQDYKSSIQFTNRELASRTLELIAAKGKKIDHSKVDGKILQAYLDMARELGQLVGNKKLTLGRFASYLFERVRILRVEVPSDTDLNHYFEVMNNRGEQLEKHEILKGELLNIISTYPDSSVAFTKIWDACSVMDRYMVMSFPRNLREQLFRRNGKGWDDIPEDFNAIRDIIKDHSSSNVKERKEKSSFLSILREVPGHITSETLENEPVTRFTSAVTFPNFLLHVLRAMTEADIKLDDKQLLPEFRQVIRSANSAVKFVKKFAFHLIRFRLMFDMYVIKRELHDKSDGWSLKSVFTSGDKGLYYAGTFGQDDDQQRIIMLLAMFHVSFPQPIYKHWLSGLLRYFYFNDIRLDKSAYIQYLEGLSDAFYFDRFGKKEFNYYDIIYKNGSKPRQMQVRVDLLNQGTAVQNFIFNRLDYLIWRAIKIDDTGEFHIPDIDEFEFTFRSSVEHFYPQNPEPNIPRWPQEQLDKFGNLCLISSRRNSKLGNQLPLAKADHYRQSETIESLKQKLMLAQSARWDKSAVRKHQLEMIEILQNRH